MKRIVITPKALDQIKELKKFFNIKKNNVLLERLVNDAFEKYISNK